MTSEAAVQLQVLLDALTQLVADFRDDFTCPSCQEGAAISSGLTESKSLAIESVVLKIESIVERARSIHRLCQELQSRWNLCPFCCLSKPAAE